MNQNNKTEKSSYLFWKILTASLGVMLLYSKAENKKKDQKIQELQQDKLKLLQENLRNSENFSAEVKKQINKLIEDYRKKNASVTIELKKILRFIEAGEDISAIKDLAKVLENLLKEQYLNDQAFLSKKRSPSLKNLIEHAKEVCLFTKRQYNTACILHDFRNQESHELAVQDTEYMKIIGLLGGLEIVLTVNSKTT